MNQRLVERVTWVVAVVLLAPAASRFAVRADRPKPRAPDRSVAERAVVIPAESLSAWATATVARDPFRLERRPASIRFGEVKESLPETPAPAKPSLRLLGTTGGPPWQGGRRADLRFA